MDALITTLAPIILPLLGAIWGGFNSIRFVHEGERAILLRFEKAVMRNGNYVVKNPGFTMFWPKINRLATIHVRTRTINLPTQILTLNDDSILGVSAIILARVIDTPVMVYHAIFETAAGVNAATSDVGLRILRQVMVEKSYADIIGNRQAIDEELRSELQAVASSWGLEIIAFSLSDCSPTTETAKLLQTRRQSEERVQALIAAASSLSVSPAELNPSLAAALVGTPLVVSITADTGETAPTDSSQNKNGT